jgi:predicted ATPase
MTYSGADDPQLVADLRAALRKWRSPALDGSALATHLSAVASRLAAEPRLARATALRAAIRAALADLREGGYAEQAELMEQHYICGWGLGRLGQDHHLSERSLYYRLYDGVAALARALWRAGQAESAAGAAGGTPTAGTSALDLARRVPPRFPLKTLGVRPHNLPAQLTSFVGREREMGEVMELIHTTRLLTLTGIGGTGKTRLALQVAAGLLGEFPAGIWFVELASLRDPGLAPQAVATVLAVRAEPDRSLSDLLADHLREKHLLLLLDNCEHLVDACARLVERLLLGAPALRILATSRVPLSLAGETTYPVSPLSLPDPHQAASQLALTQSEAGRLFIERAAAARHKFSVTDANAPAVAQICHRLEGVPLALELGAARVRFLSPDQIASRLGDRFHLLTGGSRTALPRQQTLRAAMDWSHDLLGEAERVLYRRLALFDGGFSLEAIEAVCSDESGGGAQHPAIRSSPVLDLLGVLVAHSLVIVGERKGETRYNLLQTVRQYALEKLQASGEWPLLQDRHLAYYQRLAEQGEPHAWKGEPAWIDRFEAEIDNFRAAMEHALTVNPESALLLAKSLAMFTDFTDRMEEAAGWARRILSLTEAWTPGKMKAWALWLAGDRASAAGEHQRGQELLEASLEMARELGDKNQTKVILHDLAACGWTHGDLAQLRKYAEQLLVVARELDDQVLIAAGLLQLGEAHSRSGDRQTGRQLLEQSLEMARQESSPCNIAFALHSLAGLARLEGDNAAAKAYYAECAQIRRQMGQRDTLGSTLYSWGQIALQEGDAIQARVHFEESLVIFTELKIVFGRVRCLSGFAGVAALVRQDERAARLFGAAEAVSESLDISMNPLSHQAFDPLVAAVRERLGGPAFDAACAEGRAMTLEQALECALRAVTDVC